MDKEAGERGRVLNRRWHVQPTTGVRQNRSCFFFRFRLLQAMPDYGGGIGNDSLAPGIIVRIL